MHYYVQRFLQDTINKVTIDYLYFMIACINLNRPINYQSVLIKRLKSTAYPPLTYQVYINISEPTYKLMCIIQYCRIRVQSTQFHTKLQNKMSMGGGNRLTAPRFVCRLSRKKGNSRLVYKSQNSQLRSLSGMFHRPF